MAATSKILVASMLSEFQSLTKKPEEFLGIQNSAANRFKTATKKAYDLVKNSEKTSNDALPELIIDNFDEEQIWQQLELQNESIINSLLKSVSQAVTCKNIGFGVDSRDNAEDSPVSSKKAKSILKAQKDVNDVEEALDDKQEADEDKSENDTDTEIDKIKSRLRSSRENQDENLDDEDSDELDFDFGGIGDEDDDEQGEDNNTEDLGQKVKNADRYLIEDDSKPRNKKANKGSKVEQSSIVDDKFFKLSQMEKFLEQEDRKEAKKIEAEDEAEDTDEESEDEEDVDIFEDLSSDEDVTQEKTTRKMKYSDFFAVPDGEEEPPRNESESDEDGTEEREKKVRFSEALDNPDDESDSASSADNRGQASRPDLVADLDSEGEDVMDIFGGKQKGDDQSNFEKRQERLKKKITSLEEASLAEKPWQLAGEVSGTKRPENSLLEEFLQFDQTTKLPPVITEETTKTIEEIIIQRIKDQAWDDVERKVKPKEEAFEYKKRVVLDQEKSKLSLGEIYEQEYLKQQQKEVEEVKDPDHEDIKKEMRDLFIKLDALSNFHFTPKPAAPEIKVVSNLPTISMEEVAPVSVSEATLLAPEEIQDKTKGETKGDTEKTTTDRKRERREKKAAKRLRQKEREKREKLLTKLHPGLGNKYSKEKAMKELEKSSKQDTAVKIIKDDKKQKKASTSSTTFLTKLQEEVVSQISKRKVDKVKKLKMSQKSSKKLKL